MPCFDELVKQNVIQHTPSLSYEGLTTDNLASVHCQPFHFVRIYSSELVCGFFFVCFLFIFCLFFDQTRLSASFVQHPHTHHHNELELQL